MTGNEYVDYAMRTNDGKCTKRLCCGIRKDDSRDIGGILNGCLGLAGEAGETLDIVKKWIFHEKPLDEEHLKKELGDVMWYMAMICSSFGFDLDEIMQMNIDKLMARYPDGFDTARANNRTVEDD